MESDLTKRRPSLIPGCLPGVPAGWTPMIGSLGENDQENENEDEENLKSRHSSATLDFLPAIDSYQTKSFLTIKKFRRPNDQTTMSMAHTHGICVLNTEEEEILACDHYNNRLLLFDSATDGRLLEIFRGDLATPECVVARPFYRQQIYITKAHSLSLYDLEKKTFIQKLGTEEQGHANNGFNSPNGLAVDPNSGEVYMCDTWNHRICVFSPDFRYVNRRWYLTRWQQTHHKVKPNYLALNNKNQCLVTCDDAPSYRGAVYLFDQMGYIQKIYDQESRNKSPNVEAKLNVPHGILLDDQGNWLTCCYSDPETCWVQRRLTNNDQETISYCKNKNLHGPSALAIKRDRTLIVADRDENSIFLFKPIFDSTRQLLIGNIGSKTI